MLICFISGINPKVEDMNKSFPRLEKIVEGLRKLAGKDELPNLTHENLDELIKCIKASEKYFKGHYAYDLGETSPCISHCMACLTATLEPKESVTFGSGCGKRHTEICEFCEMVPNIVRSLEHFLNIIEAGDYEDFGPLKIQMMRFDVQFAHKSIVEYMGHTIRNQIQANPPCCAAKKSHEMILLRKKSSKLIEILTKHIIF